VLDINGDGKVSHREHMALDANGDGNVNKFEVLALRGGTSTVSSAPSASATSALSSASFADSSISSASSASSAFSTDSAPNLASSASTSAGALWSVPLSDKQETFDVNVDGKAAKHKEDGKHEIGLTKVDPLERLAPVVDVNHDGKLERHEVLDINGDGKVSHREHMALDANGDGNVNKHEALAVRGSAATIASIGAADGSRLPDRLLRFSPPPSTPSLGSSPPQLLSPTTAVLPNESLVNELATSVVDQRAASANSSTASLAVIPLNDSASFDMPVADETRHIHRTYLGSGPNRLFIWSSAHDAFDEMVLAMVVTVTLWQLSRWTIRRLLRRSSYSSLARETVIEIGIVAEPSD